jgi:hypothetical protein
MKRIKTNFLCFILFLQVTYFLPSLTQSLSADTNWGHWARSAEILVREQIGLERIQEPVEFTISSGDIKSGGVDIRIVDEHGIEIPYQIVSLDEARKEYKLTFLVSIKPNGVKKYKLYYGNPAAYSPNYGKLLSVVNNFAQSWRTNGVYIQWGHPVSGASSITTLKYDDGGNDRPDLGRDRLTSEFVWDKFYGFLGSNLALNGSGGFGSSVGRVTKNGPVFTELSLGTAKIRYYRGKDTWILTNGVVDALFNFNHNWQFMKSLKSDEIFIPNWGSDDIPEWLVGYLSHSKNPGYLAFRDPSSGLIFGAVAINVSKWKMLGKYSGAWDRVISFDDSSDRPNARIYWYSDMSNSYEGIENFAKRVLNPLEVKIIKQDIPIDTTPPNTAFTINPETPDGDNGWYLTSPWVSLTPDETATTFYQLNNQDETTYTLPIHIPEGINTLNFYSVDEAGNRESTKTLEFKVDKSPPKIDVTINPFRNNNRFSVGELIEINYKVSDSLSGVYAVSASFNGKPFYLGEPLLLNSPGEKELVIRAEDRAGNITIYSKILYVDGIVSVKWQPPLDRYQSGRKVFKLGRTIPLKFSLLNQLGNLIQTEAVKVVISGGNGSIEFSVGSGSVALRYSEEEGFYIVNFHTGRYSWVKPGQYQIFIYYASSGSQIPSLVGTTSFQLIDKKKK